MELGQEQRQIYYDRELNIEAYRLSGIVQKFPNHFHDFYVIGYIEGGKRHLWCRNREYDLEAGDLVLFNPGDNHFCEPMDGTVLDYRAVNIKPEVMERAVREILGGKQSLSFSCNVLYQSDLAGLVADLYDAIVGSEEELLSMTGFGKTYLIRLFTKQVGVSPYRYLQTVRLNRSRGFLEQGIPPVDAAGMAGFSDQSHFTNFFKEFTGLTPGQYQRIFRGAGKPEHAGREKEYGE